jgi:hypothetical protein
MGEVWRFAAKALAETDIVSDRQPGKQAIALTHPGNTSLDRAVIAAADVPAIDRQEPGDDPKQAAFSDAARSEQAGASACIEVKIQPLEKRDAVIAERHISEIDAGS